MKDASLPFASASVEQRAFPNRSEQMFTITLDRSRDNLLSGFAKATLQDRYLLPSESFQDLFARVACWFASDQEHAQRLYDYISRLWFMPATPVLSNGGTNRGLPISCFLNEIEDNRGSIFDGWVEHGWLASEGGGIGTSMSKIRELGAPVKLIGKTGGIVPFLKVMDAMTLAISQGSLRRGSAAAYLRVDHPEVDAFISLRKPGGGDENRKALNLHHGLAITDEFMRAVKAGEKFPLVSPHNGSVIALVDARELWEKILIMRVDTGEPYMLFIDTVNRSLVEHQKALGLVVSQSNLCSEIMLTTGIDHHGKKRTAVCCLSSVNLANWDEWKGIPGFVQDCLDFLDNVLQDFIDRTARMPGFEHARYAAQRERSVGLGVMGFHTYLQKLGIPFESAMAKSINMRMFKKIRSDADAANLALAKLKGPCIDAQEVGVDLRFSHMLAIAPTASISIIASSVSPCIEPLIANSFTQKTLSGSHNVRNEELRKVLEKHGQDTPEVWSSITTKEGSVQHLDFLSKDEKDVFKTAFEIDQRWVVELAVDRSKSIDQGQSINLFLPADVDKWDLHHLHMKAWEGGVKSLYYLRSKSLQRADVASNLAGTMPTEADRPDVHPDFTAARRDYDECLACQ